LVAKHCKIIEDVEDGRQKTWTHFVEIGQSGVF
jgi:hypothetical protein